MEIRAGGRKKHLKSFAADRTVFFSSDAGRVIQFLFCDGFVQQIQDSIEHNITGID